MPELSLAAQAVLDAATPALNSLDACGFNHQDQAYDRKAIAAALRSAADHVKPSQQDYAEARHEFAKVCLNGMAYAANELRCLANELDPTSENV